MTRQTAAMSYLAERREEEKERRRLEIIEAAEALYSAHGWDALTMDQLARQARLSRALLYVYFRDKHDLHSAVVERALRLLRTRFSEAAGRHPRGLDKVEAIGRAYVAYALEFPHYFDACARFQATTQPTDGTTTMDACAAAGDAVLGEVVQALVAGFTDGSVRQDVGAPLQVAITLWGFTHGIIQLTTTKAGELSRHGITAADQTSHAIRTLTASLRATP